MKFGEFDVREILYESNRTLVYRALPPESFKETYPIRTDTVVLKVHQDSQPSLLEKTKFEHEFNILSLFNDPGIVRPFEYRNISGAMTIIMEDIHGICLQTQENKPLPLDRFFPLAIQLSGILDHIHQKGIIHKDIHPGNIISNPETNQLQIIDFGISTILATEYQMIENIGALEGMLAYISPEQTGRMNCGLDYRTDFYSMGVLFYELLSGQLPFYADDAIGWVYQHIAVPPKPLSSLNKDIPEMVSQLVMRLLAKNANDRYQSSSGLIRDLSQCYHIWQDKGDIPIFQLGLDDVSGQFKVSEKIEGRDREKKILLECLMAAGSGTKTLLMIFGPSGIGKSALVADIYADLITRNALFVMGKFDQFNRHVPYTAIKQVLIQLVQRLLMLPERQLKDWKSRILKALNINAQLMIDMVPDLELIIGPQPPIVSLDPEQERNRFFITFAFFIRLFALKDHPLVFYLDDIQWADESSLKLLEIILKDPEISYFYLIMAFRDNEIQSHHTIYQLKRITQEQGLAKELPIERLQLESTNRIIAATLFQKTENTMELAKLVVEKTGGNPFFVGEFLRGLHQENLITYSKHKGCWKWDIGNIVSAPVSQNVLENIIDRLTVLEPQLLDLISQASIIGNKFELIGLSRLAGKPSGQVLHLLNQAIFYRVLAAMDRTYLKSDKELLPSTPAIDEDESTLDMRFCFTHDQIRNYFHCRLTDAQKEALHLKYGRLLLQTVSEQQYASELVKIVSHLNQGLSLIKNNNERSKLIDYNFEAAGYAKAAQAFETALEYLNVAKQLFSENPWQDHYARTRNIYLDLVEVLYRLGHFEKADQSIGILLEQSRTDFEKAEVLYRKIRLYCVSGKTREAISDGYPALSCLNIHLSQKTPIQLLQLIKYYFQIRWQMRNKTMEALLDLPITHAKDIELFSSIFCEMGSALYVNGQLVPYLLYTLAYFRHIVKHGNHYGSAACLVGTAITLNKVNRPKAAGVLGDVAVKIVDRLADTKYLSKVHFMRSVFIRPWYDHWKHIETNLDHTIKYAYQSGDLWFLSYALVNRHLYDLNTGLKDRLEKVRADFKSLKQYYFPEAGLSLQLLMTSLGALTATRANWPCHYQDLEKLYQEMVAGKYLLGQADYHATLLMLSYFNEIFDYTDQYIENWQKIKQVAFSLPFSAEATFFTFLNLVAELDSLKELPRSKQRLLHKAYKQMTQWASQGPVNFEHRRLLMEAELARLKRLQGKAMAYFHQALATAKTNECLRDEAIISERFARFHFQTHNRSFGRQFLNQAKELYGHWGCELKLAQLHQRYSGVEI